MTEPVLVDAGPLVALLSERDQHHHVCVDRFRSLQRTPVTCWPVVTEAAWLLRTTRGGVDTLLEMIEARGIDVVHMPSEAAPWLREFLATYASAQAQLADATLAYLAESRGLDTVFTLDRRDFAIYRVRGNRTLQIIP